jgi:hypothetical protein
MTTRRLSRLGRIFADGRRIDTALRLAVRDAILQHRQLDLPLVMWRDGHVVWVHPRDLATKASPEKRTPKRER